MIHVYTGDGKGKTTAAVGLAVRALGHGKRVCFIQFLKPSSSGELRILKKLKGCRMSCFGRREFCRKDSLSTRDYTLARQGLQAARSAISTRPPHILILDELNLALSFGLVELGQVLDIITEASDKDIEVIITGRSAHRKIIERADLVSTIEEHKHYFQKGCSARKGIEY